MVNWDVCWTDVELTVFEQAWNEVPAEQSAADLMFKQVADIPQGAQGVGDTQALEATYLSK
ncbi:MAG TPA: hypothetical protein VHK45_05775 [Geminicoccaceae bacterium]|nr:hypothetical protein [Geminicoccaceae bacterium]